MTFYDVQNTKNRSFLNISTWNLVHIYTNRFFYIYSVFYSQKNCFPKFHRIFFGEINLSIFFPNFRIFKISKMNDSSLMETVILNVFLKTNRFSLLRWLRDSVSRKLIFPPKTGKTWRHPDVIYGRRIGVAPIPIEVAPKFPFVRMGRIDGLEGTENLAKTRL